MATENFLHFAGSPALDSDFFTPLQLSSLIYKQNGIHCKPYICPMRQLMMIQFGEIFPPKSNQIDWPTVLWLKKITASSSFWDGILKCSSWNTFNLKMLVWLVIIFSLFTMNVCLSVSRGSNMGQPSIFMIMIDPTPITFFHHIPYHTISSHTIPYHTIPFHHIPYHTASSHTIPYRFITYHTIPCHGMIDPTPITFFHHIPYPPQQV